MKQPFDISQLVDELQPVRPMNMRRGLMLPLGMTMAALAVIATFAGVRADLMAGAPHPMTAWSVGEIVQGNYRLELAPAAAPVQRVIVGLYNWQTGERLLVNGADGVMLEVGP